MHKSKITCGQLFLHGRPEASNRPIKEAIAEAR